MEISGLLGALYLRRSPAMVYTTLFDNRIYTTWLCDIFFDHGVRTSELGMSQRGLKSNEEPQIQSNLFETRYLIC